MFLDCILETIVQYTPLFEQPVNCLVTCPTIPLHLGIQGIWTTWPHKYVIVARITSVYNYFFTRL